MFVTGVIGNFAVCIVIIHNKTMHTATNYYLFSLAISDLIILLLGKLPQTISKLLSVDWTRELVSKSNNATKVEGFWDLSWLATESFFDNKKADY